MSTTWLVNYGSISKVFHKRSKDEETLVIYEGSSPEAYNFITPKIGNRVEGCCGSPVMYKNCELSKAGKERLTDLS